MKWIILAALCAAPARAQGPLQETESRAKEALAAGGAAAAGETDALRAKVRGVAAALRAVELPELEELEEEEGGGIEAVARDLRAALRGLRAADAAPELLAILDHLEAQIALYPEREYTAKHPRGITKAIARQLDEAANNAADAAALVAAVRAKVDLPADLLGSLPEDLTPEEFDRLGAIKVFLCKHRTKRPKSYKRLSARQLADGHANVGVGVVIYGTVTWSSGMMVDGDYVFDIDPIHMELGDEWKLRVPQRPVRGRRVAVYGWSFRDVFHGDETAEEIAAAKAGARQRPTIWEIHPVTGIRFLDP